MKKIFITIVFFNNNTSIQHEIFKFEKIFMDLINLWSIYFVDENNILVNEKRGKLLNFKFKK